MHQTIKSSGLMNLLISFALISLFLPPLFLSIPLIEATFTLYIGELFLLIVGYFWFLSFFKRKVLKVNSIVKVLFIFLIVSFLSIINASNIGRYAFGFLVYIETFLILLVFSNISITINKQAFLFKNYLYSGIVLAGFIVFKTVFSNEGNFILGQKIVLDIGASNYLASILLVPFYIAYTNVFSGNKQFKNITNLLVLAVLGIAIIYTGSRTVLLLMAGLTLVYLVKDILISKQKLNKKITSLVLITVGVLAVYMLGGNFINQMVSAGRFQNLSEQANLLERFVIYRQYFDAFLNHPVLGNGFSNVDALNKYFLAHNFIFQVLGDNGLVACVLFLLFIFKIISFLNKNIKENANIHLTTFLIGYKRGFYAVLLHGLLEPNFGTKLFMIYLFLGLGIILSSINAVRQNE